MAINSVTIKRLYALSNNQCAFPECLVKFVSPTDEHENLSEICHIEAAQKGGARYNANSTDDERNSFENLILLCPTHHTKVDNNPQEYTIEKLKEMKKAHQDDSLDDYIFNQTLSKEVIKSLYEQRIGNTGVIWEKIKDIEKINKQQMGESISEIDNVFKGILSKYIKTFIASGNELNENKKCNQNRSNYVKNSFIIVECIINIFVSYCLVKICKNKKKNIIDMLMALDGKDIYDKMNLLSKPLDTYLSEKNIHDDEILSLYSEKRDAVVKENELKILAEELFEINKKVKNSTDLCLSDCKRAEIILTEFLSRFSFLANYYMVSICKVDYHNMLGNQEPRHIQEIISTSNSKIYKESECELSHCMFLVNLKNEHYTNLFPFLIDYNSLKPKADTNSPHFLYFSFCTKNSDTEKNYYFNRLGYTDADGTDIPFDYDDNVKYEGIQTEKYNTNRLICSFRKDDTSITKTEEK
ncbi:MAG: hypothetical protein FWD60_12820 [Candidatus Azobacteroides sp.]|nr:hypothetical protein [Candidatus Azobacteroides sp.]